MKKILIILLFIPSLLYADEWTKEDMSLATIFTLSTIIDWGQTRDIVKNNKDKCTPYKNGSRHCDYAYYEKTNIYLGKNPSMGKVNTYMPLAIIGIITISHFLPDNIRTKFLYGMSFLELGTIYNNHKIGLKINF